MASRAAPGKLWSHLPPPFILGTRWTPFHFWLRKRTLAGDIHRSVKLALMVRSRDLFLYTVSIADLRDRALLARNVVGAPVPAHPFVRTQESTSTEPLAIQLRPKRPHPRTVSNLPQAPDSSPRFATRHLHALPDHIGGPMVLHPSNQHRIGPPDVVIAPRPREHTASHVSARTSVEDGNDAANGFIPIDATSNSSAQSTVIVGIGMQLHREDHNHAIAALSSCMHDAVGPDLAPSTGSSPVTLPRAGNRNMLHPVMPARNLSAYSSLAGAMTSTAFLPTTFQASPGAVNESEGNHPGLTVAQCEGIPQGRAVSDAFRMHDYKERDAEQHGRDVRPFPSHSMYLKAASRDSGLIIAETTRLYARAPAPVLVQQDQARSAHAHKILHPLNPQTVYARVERSAEYFGPSYLDTAYQQTYNDTPLSNAAPHYAGSCFPSEPPVTALDAPYGLSGPVNMDLRYSPAAPTSVPVQFSAHQHQVASVPSVGFQTIPHQLPSSRVELDAPQASLLAQAAAYDKSVIDNAREAYLQQEWQMLNHGAGLFAPEQPAGLDYSGADLYSQDTRTHYPPSASAYAQDVGSRSNPTEPGPQFPDFRPTGRQYEHAFTAGVSSPYDCQGGAHGQLPYNPAPSPWMAQALDLAQAAHYQRIALHPGSITHNVYQAPLELSPSSTGPLHKGAHDGTEHIAGWCAPEHDSPASGSLSGALAQGAFVRSSNIPPAHLAAVNLGADVLHISPLSISTRNPYSPQRYPLPPYV